MLFMCPTFTTLITCSLIPKHSNYTLKSSPTLEEKNHIIMIDKVFDKTILRVIFSGSLSD